MWGAISLIHSRAKPEISIAIGIMSCCIYSVHFAVCIYINRAGRRAMEKMRHGLHFDSAQKWLDLKCRITAHLHQSKNDGQDYSLQDCVLLTVTQIYSILLTQKDSRLGNPFNFVNSEGAFVDQIYQNVRSINRPCLLEKRVCLKCVCTT